MNTIYDDITRFSPDGFVHDNQRLAELQALPLHRKIGITIARITEWYNHFNGNVYVSVSGGKDSTVLWDIVHKLFPDVPAVFSNTGLEYPEIQQFAKSICTDVVTPKIPFTEVIKTYGYPIISKEVSEAVYYARRNTPPSKETIWKRLELAGERPPISRKEYWQVPPHQQDSQLNESDRSCVAKEETHVRQENVRRKMLMGSFASSDGAKKSLYNKDKWLPLVYLPFKISHYCCNVMKKSPLHAYQSQTKRYPIIGTMAEESRMRKQAWIRHGCNSFEGKKKSSQPLSFWTEQDILYYIKTFDIKICSVYGEIETLDNGKLHCTGAQRTGW